MTGRGCLRCASVKKCRVATKANESSSHIWNFFGELTNSCTATDGQALFTERTRNKTIFQSREGIQ